jgi:SAM-dependent methyltransferase
MPGPTDQRIYEEAWSAPVGPMLIPSGLWRSLRDRLDGKRLLEIGPGVKPAIPVPGSYFLDLSKASVRKLVRKGGRARQASITQAGFEDGFFGAVFALEILEHVEDDRRALSEIHRMLEPEGLLVLSVPLHMRLWTDLDLLSDHVRRYEPEDLQARLGEAGLSVEQYRPRYAPLLPWAVENPWSISVPVDLYRRYPRTAVTLTYLLGHYPARMIDAVSHPSWTHGPDLAGLERASGVTVVARKAG